MESDDLAPHVPRKRSRSASPTPSASSSTLARGSGFGPSSASANDDARPPAPKRLRRAHEVLDYHAPVEEHARRAMASANPLSRRVLKREAKKARQAAKRASRAAAAGRAGMEVDRDEEMDAGGLEATFMG